jgi:predicted RNase H-like HicB family nuclease
MDITIGSTAYQLIAVERDGQWWAHAIRGTERFGVDAGGPTREAALDALSRWLTWHHEHARALDELQQAERVYHRVSAGAAFASPDDVAAGAERKVSLDVVDAARARLDDVRGRRPRV